LTLLNTPNLSAMSRCLFLFFLALSVLSSGCMHRGDVNMVESASRGDNIKVTPDNRLITSRQLDDFARIGQVASGDASGLLKVQVPVTNFTNATARVHYQVVWFDEQGLALSTPQPVWHITPLYAGETKYLTAVAPRASVRDFQFKLLDAETFQRTGGNVNVGGPRR
jgi:uncharacterized protein YcfL